MTDDLAPRETERILPACGALRWPLPGKQVTWNCDGTGLTQFATAGGVPVVAPRVLLPFLMRSEFASAYDPQPFVGGDHVHMEIPDDVIVDLARTVIPLAKALRS